MIKTSLLLTPSSTVFLSLAVRTNAGVLEGNDEDVLWAENELDDDKGWRMKLILNPYDDYYL